MSCSAYVKDHARIKRINITNSCFIRYIANEICYGTIYSPTREESMLFSQEELKEDFSDLDFRSIELLEKEVEEGDFHQGKASVIQMVAIK
ncbi:MAG: hypothetical protein NT040_00275 [Bacteroidetes bacterium]|nr:hypothetical protein [Bacteroidota bacterium]